MSQEQEQKWKLRVMSHKDGDGEFFSIQDVLHVGTIPNSSTTDYQFQAETIEGLVGLLEEAVESVKESVVDEELLDGDLIDTTLPQDPLAPCKDEMSNLYNVIRETPNNMELGKVIRQMYNGGIPLEPKEEDTKQMELFED